MAPQTLTERADGWRGPREPRAPCRSGCRRESAADQRNGARWTLGLVVELGRARRRLGSRTQRRRGCLDRLAGSDRGRGRGAGSIRGDRAARGGDERAGVRRVLPRFREPRRCGRCITTRFVPRPSTDPGGRRTSPSTIGTPRPRRTRPCRARRSGSTTTSSNSSRRCCGSSVPTFGSGSSCTSRSRPGSSSCNFRGERRFS